MAAGVFVAEAGEVGDAEFDQTFERGVLAVGEDHGGALIELFDYRADAVGEIDKGSVVGLGIFAGLLKLRSEALDGGSEPIREG